MKTCPFCSKKPTVVNETATCHGCGISVPLDKWEGQSDVTHDIDGVKWGTTGHVVALADSLPRRLAVTRSEMMSMMVRNDWRNVTPDGYAKSAVGYIHRYRLGDEIIRVSADLETGFGTEAMDNEWEEAEAFDLTIEDMDVSASPCNSGYLMRYCDQTGEPRLFAMSLHPSSEETK